MKIAVVTGASSGIGRELLLAIDKEYDYDEIWAIARRAGRLEELGKQCRNTLLPVCLDLNEPDSIGQYQELLAQARLRGHRTLNGLGILIHQAVFALEHFTDTQLDGAAMRALVEGVL